jgi:hypothetical protein
MDIFVPAARQPTLVSETFTNGGAFTAGTTTIITLANTYSTVENIFFDAAFQGDDTFTLVGRTLTFNAAIPLGVSKVYFHGWM